LQIKWLFSLPVGGKAVRHKAIIRWFVDLLSPEFYHLKWRERAAWLAIALCTADYCQISPKTHSIAFCTAESGVKGTSSRKSGNQLHIMQQNAISGAASSILLHKVQSQQSSFS
jgi:hypothetical protein